jgi:hypothetical protein
MQFEILLKLEPGQVDSHHPIEVIINLESVQVKRNSRWRDDHASEAVEDMVLNKIVAYAFADSRKFCEGRRSLGGERREISKIVLHAHINVPSKIEIEEYTAKARGSVYCS